MGCGNMFVFPICPICNQEMTIKDNIRFSSTLCKNHRIVIYYYDTGQHLVIKFDEYKRYKQMKTYERRDK